MLAIHARRFLCKRAYSPRTRLTVYQAIFYTAEQRSVGFPVSLVNPKKLLCLLGKPLFPIFGVRAPICIKCV